jgi:hypothetical protein
MPSAAFLALSTEWWLQHAMVNLEQDEQSSSSSEGLDLDARRDLDSVYDWINVIKIDLHYRMHLLQRRIGEALPIEDFNLFSTTRNILNMDWTLLDPFPPDADELRMRQHLKDLKSLSRKMDRWAQRIIEIEGVQPSLKTLREVQAALQQDLGTRYWRLDHVCRELDSPRRQHVFQETSRLRGINYSTLIPHVGELDPVQMREHLEQLKALSRHLFICEVRFAQVVGRS